MTGMDCLKEALLQRGYTKSQADSKVVLGVVEILARSDGRYTDLDRLDKEKQELEKEVHRLEQKCNDLNSTVTDLRTHRDQILEELNEKANRLYKSTKDYIDKFFKALDETETPEGRDTIRAAQLYVNTVDVDTKYDNTAFIIGLAAILSQGNTGPIDQLRKINKEIPEIGVTAKEGNYYGRGFNRYGFCENKDGMHCRTASGKEKML